MVFFLRARRKGTKERFTNVTKGSGDGGGTRFFQTKKEARPTIENLNQSFETKIVKKKKKQNNNFGGGFIKPFF